MIQYRICSFIQSGIQYSQPRFLTTTNALCLNQKWRKERGLPLNPNRSGPLTDTPDYTFLDGRLTPCGMRQLQRIKKQREVTQQIVQLSKEMDFAIERSRQLHMDKYNRLGEILDKRLKPKGVKLLKSK